MRLLNSRHLLYSLQFTLPRHCRVHKFPNGFTTEPAVVNNYVRRRCFASKAVAATAAATVKTKLPANGPGLKQFLIGGRKPALVAQSINPIAPEHTVPYLDELDYNGHGRKVFFEVYGCQMNVNDTEIVWSILKNNGYEKVDSATSADVVLLMTCAIREKAETKVIYFVVVVAFVVFNRIEFNALRFSDQSNYRFGPASDSWPWKRKIVEPSVKRIKWAFWAVWPNA